MPDGRFRRIISFSDEHQGSAGSALIDNKVCIAGLWELLGSAFKTSVEIAKCDKEYQQHQGQNFI